jgi:proteasome assembly chaperone (PAC2) family protein
MTIKKIVELKNLNLAEYTLVVASVSNGNVGQLAADILIESLDMEKYALVCMYVNFTTI